MLFYLLVTYDCFVLMFTGILVTSPSEEAKNEELVSLYFIMLFILAYINAQRQMAKYNFCFCHYFYPYLHNRQTREIQVTRLPGMTKSDSDAAGFQTIFVAS